MKKKGVTTGKLGSSGLTLKEERFCHFYVRNETTRGNKTQSYAAGYGIDLDKLSGEKRKDEKGEVIGSSDREKQETVCASMAIRLLRKAKVSKYVQQLWNDTLKNEIVDGELAKIILQNEEMPTKLGGIREYNRLRKRITEQLQILRPLEEVSDEDLAEMQREAKKLLLKK